jgi:hypothetical protein
MKSKIIKYYLKFKSLPGCIQVALALDGYLMPHQYFLEGFFILKGIQND